MGFRFQGCRGKQCHAPVLAHAMMDQATARLVEGMAVPWTSAPRPAGGRRGGSRRATRACSWAWDRGSGRVPACAAWHATLAKPNRQEVKSPLGPEVGRAGTPGSADESRCVQRPMRAGVADGGYRPKDPKDCCGPLVRSALVEAERAARDYARAVGVPVAGPPPVVTQESRHSGSRPSAHTIRDIPSVPAPRTDAGLSTASQRGKEPATPVQASLPMAIPDPQPPKPAAPRQISSRPKGRGHER